MDFGKVETDQIINVDFSLPPTTAFTNTTLGNHSSRKDFEVYVGCAKWGRKEWVGQIYPPKTKDAQFLDEYLKHFNSIELNAVFYNMPQESQITAWRNKADKNGNDFKFCPKFTRSISHLKRLKDAEDLTTQYLHNITAFGKYLGPAFLQLSDNFGPKNFDILQKYLEELPVDFDVFVELRHQDWYADDTVRKNVFELFRKLNKGAIITDASGRRDCVHMELPTPQAFIRFVGNNLHDTDYARIDEWAERLKEWRDKGLQSLFFFLHQHDEAHTPVLAEYTIKKFNEVLNLKLKLPAIISNQTLF